MAGGGKQVREWRLEEFLVFQSSQCALEPGGSSRVWKEVAANLKMREDRGYSGSPERGSRRETTRATRRISCEEEGGGWNAGVRRGKDGVEECRRTQIHRLSPEL